ncbi:MAG: ABC transporter permease [Clostridia bacterium]|nr:ABC transporter permease [Clostridia bacterium]
MLKKKLIRTFGQYKAQFLSMIIMIAIGIGIFIGFNMEWYAIEKNTGSFFEETGFADYRVYTESPLGFSASDLKKVAEIEGVDEAALFLSADVNLDGDRKKSLALTVSTNEKVSFFKLMSGEAYDETSADGVWLSDAFASANGFRIGDPLDLVYEGRKYSLSIKGLAKSSEYLICVPDSGQMMPDYERYGFAYVSPAFYKSVTGFSRYPAIYIRSSLGEKQMKHAVNKAFSKTTLVLTRNETVSYAEAMGESTEGKSMGAILPVVFLLIAVLTMITTMHRIAAKERTQIGILKALGFRDKTVLAHYTSLSLFIGLIGAVFGIGIGYLVCYIIMNPHGAMGTYFDMPRWTLYMPWFAAVLTVVIVLLLTLVGYLSVRKTLSESPAETLRPRLGGKAKRVLLERTGAWNKLSFGAKWNTRDILRHKSRMLMSLIGVIGCTVILVGAMGMKDTMDSFVNSYYYDAMNYNSRIYLTANVTDETVRSLLDAYDGDSEATVAAELDGKAISMEIYNVTHDNVRFLGEKKGNVTLPADGAYICSRLAEEFSVKKGDVIVLSPFGKNKEYEVVIKGVVRSLTESVVLSNAYADALGIEYKADSIYTAAEKESIASSPFIKSVQSKADIIKSFDSFMSVMNLMIILLIVAGVILGTVVLYNLGTMGYNERYIEMATLKVVGFKDKKIAGLLVGENLFLTLIGLILGLPLGVLVLKILLVTLASEYEMRLVLGALTYTVSVLLTLGVSLLVSLLVARKNKKIDMVAALKAPE